MPKLKKCYRLQRLVFFGLEPPCYNIAGDMPEFIGSLAHPVYGIVAVHGAPKQKLASSLHQSPDILQDLVPGTSLPRESELVDPVDARCASW